MVKYSKRYAHVKSCAFSPCLCPQTDCNFRANSKALGEHFRTNHQLHVPPFTYDEIEWRRVRTSSLKKWVFKVTYEACLTPCFNKEQ